MTYQSVANNSTFGVCRMNSERGFSKLKTITHRSATKAIESWSFAAAKLFTYEDTQGQKVMGGKQTWSPQSKRQ